MKVNNILFVLILLFSPCLVASENIDHAIEKYLNSSGSINEGEVFEVGKVELTDLDGDKIQELVFVWALLGPTYWRNYLTVLTEKNGEYMPADTFLLNGEAMLANVIGNKIRVSKKVYVPGDPRCCPSVAKDITYLFIKGVIEIEQ